MSDFGFRYHRMRDPELVANRTVDRAVLRRVWRFARPYRLLLAVLLAAILLTSLVSILPPLVFREIIDKHAIPRRDLGGINRLAFFALLLAVADAAMGIGQRWLSARVGEGLIFNLRSALYDHVQRMPLAFFTRTQTGALISRMNNDVIGAQQAFTGTLGTVVQNIFEVVVTLAVMISLEWRLTLMALIVVPAFIIPAKRVGKGMQRLTRESFQLDAAMNNNMTERFNVSGALLVKLFGSPDRESAEFGERAGRVRDIGIKRALYSRIFFTGLALLGAVGTVAVYWWGSRLVFSGAITVGTLTALAVYVTRIYRPLTSLTNAHVDVMTALVSFERVFEVLDAPHPIADAPDAVPLVDPKGRIEYDDVWFRYPAASSVSIASLEAAMTTPLSDEPSGMILKGVSFVAEPGQMVALVGPRGRARPPCRTWCPASTTWWRGRCGSTATTSATSPAAASPLASGWSPRTRTCSTTPSAPTSATPAPRPPTSNWWPPAGRPASTISSPACPRATTPWSASGATACQGARSSGWPWPGCCSRARPSSSSTRPPPTSTQRPRCSSRPRWTKPWPDGRRW